MSKYKFIRSFIDSKKGHYIDQRKSRMTTIANGIDFLSSTNPKEGGERNYSWWVDDRIATKEEARAAYQIRKSELYKAVYNVEV